MHQRAVIVTVLISGLAARWFPPKGKPCTFDTCLAVPTSGNVDSARHSGPSAASIAGFACVRSDNATIGLILLENNMYAVNTCRNSHRGIYEKRGFFPPWIVHAI